METGEQQMRLCCLKGTERSVNIQYVLPVAMLNAKTM